MADNFPANPSENASDDRVSSCGGIDISAIKGDALASLVPLYAEMLAHYDLAVPSLSEIRRHLITLPAGVEHLVASRSGEIMGFASYGLQFPGAGLLGGLFLKELFVSRTARGSGAGQALMRALAEEALRRGCARLDWTTDIDNVAAQSFYGNLHASAIPKLYYRIEGSEALSRFASHDCEA